MEVAWNQCFAIFAGGARIQLCYQKEAGEMFVSDLRFFDRRRKQLLGIQSFFAHSNFPVNAPVFPNGKNVPNSPSFFFAEKLHAQIFANWSEGGYARADAKKLNAQSIAKVGRFGRS